MTRKELRIYDVKARHFVNKYRDEETPDTSKVQIAVLGHSEKQFSTIKDRSYLKKVYLDHLDLGEHYEFQSNAYGESRAFLCDKLFDDSAEYVGVVTASWNIKYQGFNPIDEFHNWHASKGLLISKRKDVVLCAYTNPVRVWFDPENPPKYRVRYAEYRSGGILRSLYFSKRQRKDIKKVLLGDLSLKANPNGLKVAACNQIICHKSLYNRYTRFFKDHEILPRLKRFCNTNDMITGVDWVDQRTVAYIAECVTMLWLNQQDILTIPTERVKDTWYYNSNRSARVDWYEGKNDDL